MCQGMSGLTEPRKEAMSRSSASESFSPGITSVVTSIQTPAS